MEPQLSGDDWVKIATAIGIVLTAIGSVVTGILTVLVGRNVKRVDESIAAVKQDVAVSAAVSDDNNAKLQQVAVQTDGLADRLNKATNALAFKAGEESGKAEEKANPT